MHFIMSFYIGITLYIAHEYTPSASKLSLKFLLTKGNCQRHSEYFRAIVQSQSSHTTPWTLTEILATNSGMSFYHRSVASEKATLRTSMGRCKPVPTETMRFVSFSSDKHEKFVSASTIKSHVNSNNCLLTPNRGVTEMHVNWNSVIECVKKLDFERRHSDTSRTRQCQPESLGDLESHSSR